MKRHDLLLLLVVPATLALAGIPTAGCLVSSRCQTHDDCAGSESCDRLTGQCRVECISDQDCWVGGAPVGKECFMGRCEFRFDERVTAPDFCLDVVNPKSSYSGTELCLSDLKGKVVLIYFALLA